MADKGSGIPRPVTFTLNDGPTAPSGAKETNATPQKVEAEERKRKLVHGKRELEDLDKEIGLEIEKMKRHEQMITEKKKRNLELEETVETVNSISRVLGNSEIVYAIIKDLPDYRHIGGDKLHESKLPRKPL